MTVCCPQVQFEHYRAYTAYEVIMSDVPYDIKAQTVEIGSLGGYPIVGQQAGWGIRSRDGMVDVQSPFAGQSFGSLPKETQDRVQVRLACAQLRKTTSHIAPEAVRAGAAMWLYQRDVRMMGHFCQEGWSFHPLCRGYNIDAHLPDFYVHNNRDELHISLRVHLCQQAFVDLAFVDMRINHHTNEVRVRSSFDPTNGLEKALCAELQVYAGRLVVAETKTLVAREHLLERLAWLNITR